MTIEERLANVERELTRTKRRYRLAMIGAIAAGAIMAALAGAVQNDAAVPDELRARSFVVVDEDGKSRALLAMKSGGPHLTLFDDRNTARVALEATAEVLRLLFQGSQGTPVASLGATDEGAVMALADEKGNPRAVIEATKWPQLRLLDETGKGGVSLVAMNQRKGIALHDGGAVRAILTLRKEGPSLAMFDEDGTRRTVLEASTGIDGLEGMQLSDATGNNRLTLRTTEDGATLSLFGQNNAGHVTLDATKLGPGITLFDEKSRIRAMLDVSEAGPALTLFDKDAQGRAMIGAGKASTSDGGSRTYPESSILLLSPDGTVRWSAPR